MHKVRPGREASDSIFVIHLSEPLMASLYSTLLVEFQRIVIWLAGGGLDRGNDLWQ